MTAFPYVEEHLRCDANYALIYFCNFPLHFTFNDFEFYKHCFNSFIWNVMVMCIVIFVISEKK